MPKCRVRWEFHKKQESLAVLHVDDCLFDSEADDEGIKAARRLLSKLSMLTGQQDLCDTGLPPELTPAQREFMESLRGIRGICQVTVTDYKILFRRSRVFEWTEIMSKVASVVKEFLAATEVKVQEPIRCDCSDE